MSADHPLIGHGVRVRIGLNSPKGAPYFNGIILEVQPPYFTVMRSDDGSVGVWWQDTVTFSDPERAARMLRAHAADNEARSLGLKVEPEYAPPRWVPANDVEDGWPFLAAVDPDGEYIALEPSGKRLLPGDTAVFRSRDALVLIGEWPPLPNGKS